jgi:hypothetical protein
MEDLRRVSPIEIGALLMVWLLAELRNFRT